jgi:dGTPase
MALAPYAVSDSTSRGRRVSEPAPAYRSEYQRDRDRIIHSAAFRRLEYKTQVFVNHEGDMYRTRLTHSIEVAQISRSVARILALNEDLMETIALAHDLGHTPFGHAGQDALNEAMGEHGGFEHNLQSLRVVDRLELRYAEFPGLNLTFEAREGILKHCAVKNARKLGDVGERFINRQQPSLEAQAVNIADGIAYNSHDVDDGLRSQLINIDQLCEVRLFRRQFDEVTQRYPGIEGRQLVHEIVRRIINIQVVDLVETSKQKIAAAAPRDVDAVRQHSESLIGFSEEMTELNHELKQFLRTRLYRHFRVHRMSTKATHIVKSLFAAFMDDARLLPPEHQGILHEMEQARGTRGRARAVADYVAGMTDRFAIREYERIYSASGLT